MALHILSITFMSVINIPSLGRTHKLLSVADILIYDIVVSFSVLIRNFYSERLL